MSSAWIIPEMQGTVVEVRGKVKRLVHVPLCIRKYIDLCLEETSQRRGSRTFITLQAAGRIGVSSTAAIRIFGGEPCAPLLPP